MKNVLITAATKGIGRAIAIAFAGEGANLAICSRSAAELQNFRQELLAIDPAIKVVVQAIDGSDKTQLLDFAKNAENELGFIDTVVNNLGMFDMISILDETDEAFDKQWQTNLMPAYQLYKYFGKKMQQERQGHFFTICSVAALEPIAGAGTYSITKIALLGLTRVMKLEMQAYDVKVTAVIPGSTLTNSWEGTTISPDKFVLPEDVASAVLNIRKMSIGANVDEIIIRPVGGQI